MRVGWVDGEVFEQACLNVYSSTTEPFDSTLPRFMID
jgi:hypothetical protein